MRGAAATSASGIEADQLNGVRSGEKLTQSRHCRTHQKDDGFLPLVELKAGANLAIIVLRPFWRIRRRHMTSHNVNWIVAW